MAISDSWCVPPVTLTMEAAECDPMYEVVIGGWGNEKSVIRKNRIKPDVAEVPTPGILSDGEFRTFWICWNNNTISCGCENNPQPFISFSDSEYVPIRYVGVCTGWGATGSWIIKQSAGGEASEFASRNSSWISSSGGDVPPFAFIGGVDHSSEPLYVIRCHMQGSLIPGKLHQRYRLAYIPLNGIEHERGEYEVLCNFGGRWVSCSGGNIPPNAFVAGHTEDGEPLYVGRAVHQDTLHVGKVQQSHRCCYIPYGGKEFNYPEYEILVL